ncbi:hypothetical protein [Candidatus Poriferisodalis sp.]|uniref:hypothetical protein n=1 Tax=Candidatus Poriferisodalis sp. TaxID=3101277 RepID=UPI003B5B82C6
MAVRRVVVDNAFDSRSGIDTKAGHGLSSPATGTLNLSNLRRLTQWFLLYLHSSAR